ncbi:hypothetical protein K432DRAFT_326701 [Lepidopterella palustris CBS 459.81]|uniref:Uncharacterized protein n=1 Tax=Lepidopterella palustris CBS 459.81 TaxID=1314670 RepID=A0A8E2EBY2_9PEZI|nr:hypothetical protein K432DRAFT_326701 [Lepidopterella palustris CBS 459.81]
MKFSAIIIASLFSTVFAASSTITEAATTVAGLTPAQTCLLSCSAGDVNCQAQCVGAAHPNSSQADQTNQCAGKCDQGDGSPAATEKYSQCVQACISSYFPTSQTVAAAVGSGVASNAATISGTAAGSSGPSAGASKTGTLVTSVTGTATGAAATSSKTGAAAVNNVQLGASVAGIAGFFMAIFAL